MLLEGLMTVSLLVLVPISLLVLVATFCFVGCVLNTHGLGDPNKPDPDNPDPKPEPFTNYSKTVTDTDGVLAFWSLNEASDIAAKPVAMAKADDIIGGHTGNYTHKGNAPDFYPCPGMNLAAGVDSAAANGFLSLGVESIVVGDAKQPGNDPSILSTGMQIDGGFVTVPFSSDINPLSTFTIECWARPEWDISPPAYRMIIDSRDAVGGTVRGYAVGVNDLGIWEATIHVSDGTSMLVAGGMATLSEPTHVVLTFDGTNAAIFINGTQTSAPTAVPGGATFSSNTTSPFIIGAGLPWLLPREQGGPDLSFPLLPFKGTIQDVAFYNTVLSNADITKHFDDGSGKTMVP
jgi:hypothetical protein